jgi:hypothetical protein
VADIRENEEYESMEPMKAGSIDEYIQAVLQKKMHRQGFKEIFTQEI